MSQQKSFRIALPILLVVFLFIARAEAQLISAVPVEGSPEPGSSGTAQHPVPDAHAPSRRRLAQDAPPLAPVKSPHAPTGQGTYLTYQGRLTNKAGEPITTAVDIVFRLYDASATMIYTSSTHTVTPIEGMFTVHIGAPPDPPVDLGILSTVAEIGVTVGSDEEMTPRQSINTVIGSSVAGVGVAGNSKSSHGVYGSSNSSALEIAGVYGRNHDSGSGVYGLSDAGPGVYGQSTDSYGIYGYSQNSTGVDGLSESQVGVLGTSFSHIGVAGYTSGTQYFEAGVLGYNYGIGPGVYGESADGFGVYGHSQNNTGVDGSSENGIGVLGNSFSHTGVAGYTSGTQYFEAGVLGYNYGIGPGVYGESADGFGVYGHSQNNIGVDGSSENSIGVQGNSFSFIGVAGTTTSSETHKAGVYGLNYGTGPGVFGGSGLGTGIHAETVTGTAGYLGAMGPGQVLRLQNNGAAGTDSDGSGGGAFIEAVNRDGQDVQFRVTTSGTVQSDGAYTTPAADFAEMLPAVAGVEPGDVLVVGGDGRLTRSTAPYQATVVGVYSTEPGFIGGRDIDGNAAGDVPLAIVGVVPVKVSAENGAIRPGDLLVASATPAHAMRAGTNPPNGTVIGKALGTLTEGTGVIQMLVILQ
jgi:hypothetical protein